MTLGDGTTINDGLTLDHARRVKALAILCEALFGRNNLIATDFGEVRVSSETSVASRGQQVSGRTVSFFIANDAMGKIMDKEVADALDTLR